MDYFIKTADETQLTEALVAAGVCTLTPESTRVTPAYDVTNEDGTVTSIAEFVNVTPSSLSANEGFALDVIGQIFKPTGEMLDADGYSYPEMAPIEGCHANLRGALSEAQSLALADVLIAAPGNPARVWA